MFRYKHTIRFGGLQLFLLCALCIAGSFALGIQSAGEIRPLGEVRASELSITLPEALQSAKETLSHVFAESGFTELFAPQTSEYPAAPLR